MFSITVLKESIYEAVTYIKPIVTKDVRNSKNDCIMMTVKQGSVELFMYNAHETVEVDVVCSKTSTKGDVAPFVSFDVFSNILDTIPDGNYIDIKENIQGGIDISYGTRKPMVINGKGGNYVMPTKPAIFSADRKKGASIDVSFLFESARKASHIIQKDGNVTSMNDYYKVTAGNPDITAECIDTTTKRTFYMKRGNSVEPTPKTFLINAERMEKMAKIFKNYYNVYVLADKSITMFAADTAAVINSQAPQSSNDIVDIKYARINITGNFPNISQFYGQQYEPKEFITVNKNDMLDAITRVEAVLDKGNAIQQAMKISAKDIEFNISYTSVLGSVDESVATQGKLVKPILAAFKPDVFKDIIKNIDSEFIDIGVMNQTTNNYLIRGSSIANNKYVSEDKYTLLTLAHIP